MPCHQVPAKPKSPVGEMLAYYFKEAPHLLRPAIEDQFQRLSDARSAQLTPLQTSPASNPPLPTWCSTGWYTTCTTDVITSHQAHGADQGG